MHVALAHARALLGGKKMHVWSWSQYGPMSTQKGRGTRPLPCCSEYRDTMPCNLRTAAAAGAMLQVASGSRVYTHAKRGTETEGLRLSDRSRLGSDMRVEQDCLRRIWLVNRFRQALSRERLVAAPDQCKTWPMWWSQQRA